MSWLIAGLIACLMITIRWRTHDSERVNRQLDSHEGFIFVVWHERIFPMSWLWPRGRDLSVLQSTHPDGQLMSKIINHFGIHTIWGSSTRNAISGLRELKRALDQGRAVGITPDGPRGPARVAASGTVALAQLTGKPIVPAAWATDRYWRAGGWDRMVVPRFFSRGVFVIGEPIAPPAKRDRETIESHCAALADAINAVTEQAERLVRDRK